MKDVNIARKFITKYKDAKARGLEFDISLVSFKNMMKSKKCAISGMLLTDSNRDPARFSDRTVDRIDSNKGYVKGNVMCVCSGINKFKGILENNEHPMNLESVEKVIKVMKSVK